MLTLPIRNRSAIHPSVTIVSRRNRRAIRSLSGSPLRRLLKSSSASPRRFNSSATIRCAFASADSRNSSP